MTHSLLLLLSLPCVLGGNPHSLISTPIHSTFSINVSIYIDTAECFHKLYLGVREAEGQQSGLNLTYTDANKSSICAAMFHSVTGLWEEMCENEWSLKDQAVPGYGIISGSSYGVTIWLWPPIIINIIKSINNKIFKFGKW